MKMFFVESKSNEGFYFNFKENTWSDTIGQECLLPSESAAELLREELIGDDGIIQPIDILKVDDGKLILYRTADRRMGHLKLAPASGLEFDEETFLVGETVELVDDGKVYDDYEDWVKKNVPDGYTWKSLAVPMVRGRYTVVAYGPHSDANKDTRLYAIANGMNQVFVVSWKGIVRLDGVTKEA